MGVAGPIVRINPYEIHIDDPDYFEEIYAPASKKRDKYGWWVKLAGAPQSGFSTVAHDQHRLRRAALNPFFSKRSVTQLEPVIRDKVEKLAGRFEKAMKTGEVIRLDAAYMALTMDVITQYAYAKSCNYLDEDDFKLEWKKTLLGAFEKGALLRHFPWMLQVMNAMPDWLVLWTSPGMGMLFSWQREVRKQVKSILETEDPKADKSTNTIFHALRDSDLPNHEKTLDRLSDEGEILIGAGSETTAKTLTTISYYLLQNRELLQRLAAELRTALPTPQTTATCSKLEQLPYLSAVISEGLRLSYGVTTRLPRIAATEVLTYKDWEIPAGTPVSQTPYFVLMNPRVFPDPKKFDPDRWLTPTENGQRLDRYLVSFGKGSRQCLGMNLAYAELYLTTATVFRRFEMALFETTIKDIEIERDFFVAVPSLDSKGVRAVITRSVTE
ncbi:MAG: hypothetical protein M1830_000392 [Pleopsidium flavum]|nr:MAG: hypothetical protein M1830_000392 [Pleopsidium flavum]